MKSEATPGPTKTETLFGGKTITVKFKDGHTEEILVQQLDIDGCEKLFPVLNSETAMAEIYVGKEKGWTKSVARESVMKIIEIAEALNADFFFSFARRQLNRIERLALGSTSKMLQASGLDSQIKFSK